MTQDEARIEALHRHPECSYAEVVNGLSWNFRMTWCVNLWRNEECWAAGDPPKALEQGFPAGETNIVRSFDREAGERIVP